MKGGYVHQNFRRKRHLYGKRQGRDAVNGNPCRRRNPLAAAKCSIKKAASLGSAAFRLSKLRGPSRRLYRVHAHIHDCKQVNVEDQHGIGWNVLLRSRSISQRRGNDQPSLASDRKEWNTFLPPFNHFSQTESDIIVRIKLRTVRQGTHIVHANGIGRVRVSAIANHIDNVV